MIELLRILKIFAITLVVFSSFSCQNTVKKKKENEVLKVEFDTSMVTINYKSNEFVVPSARHATEIIKKYDIKYNPSVLHDIKKAEKYTTIFKQSLNLGIYGTDFCYLNVYDKPEKSMDYFLALDILLQELNIKDYLDDEELQSFEDNISNSDSLLTIFSRSMNDIDRYLKQNNRDHIAILIVAGGWIESFFLSTQSYLQRPDSEMLSYIVKQKYALDKVIKLLAPYYKNSKEYSTLVDQLSDLAYEFDCIDIEYSYNEPSIEKASNFATIKNSSVINLNNYDLKNIAGIIKQIRFSITL